MSSRTPGIRGVRVEARAKLNLGLAVGPRRADGFHELATVFQSIDLADVLEVRPRRRGFSLKIVYEDVSLAHRGGGRPPIARVPADAGNLVLRAARLLASRCRLSGGVSFRLVKRIPTAAGLGGGSADAAATLVGLAALHGLRLGRSERLGLAAELGSDVPFAVTGGTAVGFGRGERLHPLRPGRGFRVLIAKPRWGVSTAQAYARIDMHKYGLTGWRANLRFAQTLVRKGLKPPAPLRMGNTFEQVLGDRTREFESLCGRLRACGLEGPRMTGSGSAVFAYAPSGLSLARAAARFEGPERLFAAR
ncbi:MAG TPA: 4-(cytidine 5'-diphospho)-2-C-methyl-D-erythritol kinase, partial [Dongiaceae bacterium]|nr:4-(cytidine 5'-diphospho)-2-C-methyl-D-erythritol kinase [Dongiaceae bacterium]